MQQVTDWLAGFWQWMVQQSVEGYDLLAYYFRVLSSTEQYAIAAVSLVLATVITVRLREGGIVFRTVCFLACLALFLALGIGLTYLAIDLMDPDSLIRHPVPSMDVR